MLTDEQLLEPPPGACTSCHGGLSPASFRHCSAASPAIVPNKPGGAAAAPLLGGKLDSWSSASFVLAGRTPVNLQELLCEQPPLVQAMAACVYCSA